MKGSDGSFIISGADNIENFRRMAIVRALEFNINHGFWPAGPKSNPMNAVRSYGWEGRTAKRALIFMKELGMVPPNMTDGELDEIAISIQSQACTEYDGSDEVILELLRAHRHSVSSADYEELKGRLGF